MTPTPRDSHLFVVGASAGGIEALERLVAALPPTFPGSIVIAQHLAPSRPSLLEPILARQAHIPVTTVTERARLESGRIYLIPGGRHAEITGDEIELSSKLKGTRPQPSIDLLFESAAAAFGDRVIAVVLSGMGRDGAAGAAAIKDAGGMVIVQQPDSAAFPALPESIPAALVDLVADIDSMGSLISSLAIDNSALEKIADPEVLKAFLSQLRGRTGIDFTKYKTPTILRRLSRLMAISRCATLPEYLRYLNNHPNAYQRLIGAFLIKVTGFFRDPALFAHLQKDVLPQLIAHARANDTPLRLWSAGCSTGEEAYSLGIALAEILGNELDDFPIRIFATDLDDDAIGFARRGIYSPASLASLPRELRTRYFTETDNSYQVKKSIRNLTVFGEYDLGQRAPFPRIDLLLCRNVLIYFTKELQQRTLQLFAFSLRSGGYLVLGNSESTSPLAQYFTLVHPTLKIYRREPAPALVPAGNFAPNAPLAERPATRRIPFRGTLANRQLQHSVLRSSLTDRLGAFLFDSGMGVLIVNRDYDIVAINQAARTMLNIFGQGVGDDLIHLTAELGPAELKSSLDAVFRKERQHSSTQLRIRDGATDEERVLEISCHPDRTVGEDKAIEALIGIIVDVTNDVHHRDGIERQNHEHGTVIEELTRRNNELHLRQRALTEANKELTASNDDLRNANEHLLVAAEEAEAAAEEVETLNEEMQATGEELETLNEELQATVEELNTTNEELLARGSELERQAGERATAVAHSEKQIGLLLEGFRRVPLAAALLDPDGTIVASTERYDELAAAMPDTLSAKGERVTGRRDSISVASGDTKARYRLSFRAGADGATLLIVSTASGSADATK